MISDAKSKIFIKYNTNTGYYARLFVYKDNQWVIGERIIIGSRNIEKYNHLPYIIYAEKEDTYLYNNILTDKLYIIPCEKFYRRDDENHIDFIDIAIAYINDNIMLPKDAYDKYKLNQIMGII